MVALLRTARQFHYPLSTLLAWGKSVAEEWALRNAVNVCKDGDWMPVMVQMQKEIIGLKAQNTELMQRADRSEKKLDQIISLLSAPPTQLPSPGHKRSRGASPVQQKIGESSSATASATAPAVPTPSTVLRPPSPAFKIDGKMPIYELCRVWFQRGYTTVNGTERWSTDSKQVTSAVRSAMTYAEGLLTPELRDALKTPAPSADNEGYSEWNKKYLQACRQLVALVTETLQKADSSKFQSVVSVNAVGARASKLRATTKAANSK